MRLLASLGCVALVGACSFDSMGAGGAVVLGQGSSSGASMDEPDAPGDSDDDGRPPGADGGSEGPLGDDGGDTSGSTTGMPPGDTGDESGDGGHDTTDGSGGQQTCPADVMQILWADDASVSPPMELLVAEVGNDNPKVATSAIADEGTVVFDLEVPCPGEYYVWALVWDYYPGAWGNPDPDSYFVSAGGPEFTWRYGCQTFGETHALTWQTIARLDSQPCEATPIHLVAEEAGTYALSFRNREAGSGSGVAAIAALLLTTDPNADPYAQYDPY